MWPVSDSIFISPVSFLVVGGSSDFILSKEGVTQGDPLSMMMYSVSVLSLIRSLIDRDKWNQNWYADDSSCIGKLVNLKEWYWYFGNLKEWYWYFVEPSKSKVVVDPSYVVEAKSVFDDLGVQVVTSSRFLGGFVGDLSGISDHLSQKVNFWTKCVVKLAKIAESQPQVAYAALSKSLQSEWSFLHRVVPNCGQHFIPARDVIDNTFWPSLFHDEIDEFERQLFSLPTRIGGLEVRDPVESASWSFNSSRSGVAHLVNAVKGLEFFVISEHLSVVLQSKSTLALRLRSHDKGILETLCDSVDGLKIRVLKRAVDWRTSNWLSVLPLSRHHFDLSPNEFRDALCLRYNRGLVKMPVVRDGCGDPSSVQHALDCRKGGLVIKRHNEIRDVLGDVCSMAFSEIMREPIANDNESALLADLSVRGLWKPQVDSLIDIRVVNTDARSYLNKSVATVLKNAEEEKKENIVMQRNLDVLPSRPLSYLWMVPLVVQQIN